MTDLSLAKRWPVIVLGFCLSSICLSSSSSSNDEKTSFENKRFVSASYFQSHESLQDSAFQQYIHNVKISSVCRSPPSPYPRISIRRRQLIGHGYHRHLSSTIEVVNFPPSCKLVLIEKLPDGVFSDFFELERQFHRSELTTVTVMGDTNVELPTFLSNRTLVEVHLKSGLNPLPDIVELTFSLPVHARYPPLDDSGYHEVRFCVPDILLYCASESSGNDGIGSCLVAPVVHNSTVNYNGSSWQVPSGRKAHENVVSVVTFFVALAFTFMIVLMSFSPNLEVHFLAPKKLVTRLKQS